jgi:nicotinate-nucleotide adenylyltransferase
MKVGLYFGTFNPIHVGHLVIANYMADFTDLDQVWLVVSPLNPLKEKASLLADYHRLALVNVAIEDNSALRTSDIEFRLPKPSYTINTLVALEEKHPEHSFSLIMGEDNLRTLNKWRNYEKILDKHHIYVYPRPLTESEIAELAQQPPGDDALFSHPNVHVCDAPVMKVSSSFIRKAIREGKDVRYLLTDQVYRYVKEMHFYEK